ncbi:MAG: hypothetical protein RJA98_946, partial [Pseudomonadota bacterium]
MKRPLSLSLAKSKSSANANAASANAPHPKDKRRTAPHIQALEPRVLLDAAMAATLHEHLAQPELGADAAAVTWSHNQLIDALTQAVAPTGAEASDNTAITRPASSTRHEIAFVDGSVADLSALLAALDPSIDVVLLDPNRDGVEQIAAALQGRSNLDAIHILSHGAQGQLFLGNVVLDATTMQGEHLDELTAIGHALSVDGDILVYGCDFTSGDAGLKAAMLLGGITGADVAASRDLTGDALHGGNWDLEERIGSIEARTLVVTSWQGELATPVNTVPAAQTTPEDTNLVLSTALGNAIQVYDADGTSLTVRLWAEHGTLTLSTTAGLTLLRGDGTNDEIMIFSGNQADLNAALNGLIYTPTFDTVGQGAINIRTSDGTTTDQDRFTVNITALDDTNPDAVTTATSTPVTINVLANDSFKSTAYTLSTSSPAHGTASVNAAGNVVYTPTTGYTGTDTFTYTVATVDSGFNYKWWPYNPIESDTFSVAFPSGFPSTPTSGGWTPGISALDGVLAASDQGDNTDNAATIQWQGVFVVRTGGSYTFTLNADNVARLFVDGSVVGTVGYNSTAATSDFAVALGAGNHTFVVQYGDTNANEKIDLFYKGADTGNTAVNVNTDKRWGSSITTETETVTVYIGVPIAVNDSATTNEDTAIVSANLASNDVPSPDGGNVWSLVTAPSHGTAVVNAAGTYTYTPAANWNGSDSFTYKITDTNGDTSTATVSLTVAPVNDAPVDGNETNTVIEDTPLNVAAGTPGSLLLNATDVDGDTLTITGYSVSSLTGIGSLSIYADGSYSFTPALNYTGAIPLITYTISDGKGGTDTSTLALSMSPVNDAPTSVAPASASTTEDATLNFTAGNTLSVADVDSTPLT